MNQKFTNTQESILQVISCTRTTQESRSGQIKFQVNKNKYEQARTSKVNDTRICSRSSHPQKDAMSPLRSSQRAGLPYNPYPHPIHHLGGLSSQQLLSTKDGVIQTSRGAHTQEGAPRVMPKYLGASSKSNKRESPDGDASSTLRRTWLLTLVKKLKLILESSSHPSPCLDSLKILAHLGFGGVFWKLEEGVCSCGVSSLN